LLGVEAGQEGADAELELVVGGAAGQLGGQLDGVGELAGGEGAYAASLRARGKPPGVIATAMANRANRIDFAMVRDQRPYDPNRWR